MHSKNNIVFLILKKLSEGTFSHVVAHMTLAVECDVKHKAINFFFYPVNINKLRLVHVHVSESESE